MTPTRRIDFHRLEPGLSERFDVLCLDTEFTRLPLPKEGISDWAQQVRVLSVGVAAISGGAASTFYVKRRIDRATRLKCTPFVIAEVLPATDSATADAEATTDLEVGTALHRFRDQRQHLTGLPALLAVDWPGDAYLIEAITGEPLNWLLLEGVSEIQQALDRPAPEGWVRHNALHDALMVRGLLRGRMGLAMD